MTKNAHYHPAALASRQIELLSLAQGFLPASVLFALYRLDIFGSLGHCEKSLGDLAEPLAAPPQVLARLLNTGVMLGLLERGDGEVYRVSEWCRPLLLDSSEEGYLGHWLAFMESWYRPFADLDAAVLSGGHMNMYEQDPDTIRRNTLAMHNFASVRGKELVDVLDTTGCRSLLDVGCGPGTYAFELGLKNPELRLYLLDLPAVLEVTREVQARYELANEVRYLPCDVGRDPIPGSYDVVLASNVLQAFPEEQISALMQRLYAAISPGGSLVVQAQHLAEDRLGPRWSMFVDLGCLCFTSGGRNHTMMETRSWLERAGLVDLEHQNMNLLNTNSFVRGYKR